MKLNCRAHEPAPVSAGARTYRPSEGGGWRYNQERSTWRRALWRTVATTSLTLVDENEEMSMAIKERLETIRRWGTLSWRVGIAVAFTLVSLALFSSWEPSPRNLYGSSVFSSTRWGPILLFAIPVIWSWVALRAAHRRTRIRGFIATTILVLLCAFVLWYAEQRVMLYCLTGNC